MIHCRLFFYRLGILGFLSTEDEVLPGNLGMKDQVQGLRLAEKKNILRLLKINLLKIILDG